MKANELTAFKGQQFAKQPNMAKRGNTIRTGTLAASGCSNKFMKRMEGIGYQVEGADSDLVAVDNARGKRLAGKWRGI